MKLISEDFENNTGIPSEFTCDGRDISPQLSWIDVPKETKSFALSVEDPDAPMGTFIHWLVYDIPKNVNNIPRNTVPKGSLQIENTVGKKSYMGPCPPSGTHRYIFTLYALNVEHLENVNRNNFFNKVEEHTIVKAKLIGLYKRR
jgi:Raf kinase inhibitor-like YbhB/YbcL family protein